MDKVTAVRAMRYLPIDEKKHERKLLTDKQMVSILAILILRILSVHKNDNIAV